MKIIKQILPAFCFLMCGLLLSLPVTAQETNLPQADVETAAQSDSNSNAAQLDEAANQAGTNPVEHDTRNYEDHGNPQPIVLFGQNAELKAGETAETVVVIGGSATIHGRVRQAVVVINGDVEVDGEVGEAAVAVFGSVHLKPGAVIRRDAVAIFGTVSADSNVKIGGNSVAVGGKLELADGVVVKGNKVNVGFPPPFSNIDWMRNWFKYCVLELRPLAPQVGFVWVIAAIFFLIYLFVAAIFPRPVQTCLNDLNRRPATIFLIGLLAKLLVPVVYLILAITGIGLIAVPIIGVTLFLFAIVGKVAILEWLGTKVGRHLGSGFQKPLAAFLLGTLIITLLYLVPVLGLLTSIIFGIWGLGGGITAVFGRARQEAPQNMNPPTPGPEPASAPMAAEASFVVPPIIDHGAPPPSGSEAPNQPPVAEAVSPGVSESQPPSTVKAGMAPVAIDVSAFPLATLWQRLLAAVLDIILIAILTGFAHLESVCLIVALAYFVGMWTWRGTTIGGIVLKLKVVRSDGRPLTWIVAIVRGLAAAFSTVVLFLGFFWIAWDKNKQGWHDKIAGTTVIRLPHSTPLV